MACSFVKCLKFNSKIVIFGMGSWGLLALSGCASLPPEGSIMKHDAPHNFTAGAQAAWDAQPFTANADYHFTLAQAYSSEGKVDRAIEEYRAALSYDPQSSVLHARLAAEYLKKGVGSFAIEEGKRAIEIDPNYIDAHLMLGGVYSLSNQSEAALSEYEAVLKIQPTNDEAAVFKTQVLAEQNRFDDALKFIRKFTSKVKDSAAAWFYAGKLEQPKNTTAAIRAYRYALDLRPGFTQATVALGMIFEMHGENQKALELYEAQMEEKQDVQVGMRLATIYLKLSQHDLALKTLAILKVLDPEDLNTQVKIGLVYMQKEQWGEAEAAFTSILEKVPDSDKVNYYLAAVYEEEGKIQNAIEHLQKVGIDSKLYEDSTLHAAGLYRKLLMKDRALELLQGAIQKAPENAGFYLVTASLYEDDQDLKHAEQTLESGLKIFPDHEKMRYFHGAMLDKLGKQDEAVAEMEILLKKNPNHSEAMNFIAYAWTSQGVHLKDAEELLKKALRLSPNNPFILDSMGWNQFMMGKNQDALVYLEKAASLKSDERDILEHLVEVYSRAQMPDRAQATRVRIEKLQNADSLRRPASVDQK